MNAQVPCDTVEIKKNETKLVKNGSIHADHYFEVFFSSLLSLGRILNKMQKFVSSQEQKSSNLTKYFEFSSPDKYAAQAVNRILAMLCPK